MTNLTYTNGRGDRTGRDAQRPQGGPDFVNALQDAVRENPVSAALIGMGVLWMFMGGSTTSLFGGSGRKSIFGAAAHGGEEVGSVMRDTASHAGGAVRRASADITDAAVRTVGEARDAASAAYDSTADMASRGAEAISKATSTAANALQESGVRLGSTVQQNLSDLFERQPLLLGAVGVAIGAGIAASLPATETEKKVMGEAAQALRETVSETTSQVKGQVKEMASAAMEEAKKQGITPDAAGDALQSLGEKVSASAQGMTGGSTGQQRAGLAAPNSPPPIRRRRSP